MLWRAYMSRHQQNFPWQYHNGGVWPFVGGFWVAALVKAGRQAMARAELAKLARANELNEWEFNEWLHGQTLDADRHAGTVMECCSISHGVACARRAGVPRARREAESGDLKCGRRLTGARHL